MADDNDEVKFVNISVSIIFIYWYIAVDRIRNLVPTIFVVLICLYRNLIRSRRLVSLIFPLKRYSNHWLVLELRVFSG